VKELNPMTHPMLERLLDDDVVHDRLADAAKRLRDAAVRARKLPNDRAVQDKKVYDNLRRATADLTSAFRRVEAPPTTHRVRTLVLALAAGVAAAVATSHFRQPSTRA
jgi:hypothetical protein